LTPVSQQTVDEAFASGFTSNVRVIRRLDKCWIFSFQFCGPGENPQVFTLKTQRGKVRAWSDPRTLFAFLDERYGVRDGDFVLSEDI
jgi:hypothetical protein